MTSRFGSDGDGRGPVRVETVVIGAGQAGLATATTWPVVAGSS